jgi:two-component system response regulator RegA
MLNTIELAIPVHSGTQPQVAQTDRRVILVDPDRSTSKRLAKDLGHLGYGCDIASDVQSAAQLVSHPVRTEALVIDTHLGGPAAFDLIATFRRQHPAAVIVVLTGHGSMSGAFAAIQAGASEYLEKPCDAASLRDAIEGRGAVTAPDLAIRMPFGRVAWEHVHRVYEIGGRSRSEAARRLGMHRRSLQRMMAKRAPR